MFTVSPPPHPLLLILVIHERIQHYNMSSVEKGPLRWEKFQVTLSEVRIVRDLNQFSQKRDGV